MITRYALFEGHIHAGQTEAFRAAILNEVLPLWKALPGLLSVRVCFEHERDEGAPELPLILALSYPNLAALDIVKTSPELAATRVATRAVVARFFTGKIHHHNTEVHEGVL